MHTVSIIIYRKRNETRRPVFQLVWMQQYSSVKLCGYIHSVVLRIRGLSRVQGLGENTGSLKACG